MTTLPEIRDRAKRHEEELARDERFLTPKDLAARWHVSTTTVLAIARDALPYLNLSQGLKREHRRYKVEDVYAYETARLEQSA